MKVKLKNNLEAKINITHNSNVFVISAKDDNNNTVGFCKFKIVYLYKKILSQNFREKYAKYNKISLKEVPTTHLYKAIDAKKFTIENNSVVLCNGNSYPIENVICELSRIEITNKNYYKVGLGSQMLKHMEQIAKDNNCTSIEGMYIPNGEFQLGALPFYKNNGFVFTKEYGLTTITKSL